MNNIAIIPARMASSRFPGKPMKKIHGMPMIEHIYNRIEMVQNINKTYIATCDDEIYTYVKSFNGCVIMTSSSHQRCTDRSAEAINIIEKEENDEIDIVTIVQGDEPMVVPSMVDNAIDGLIKDTSINIVNLISEIKNDEEFQDKNTVKVVIDKLNNALYFSREPIPSFQLYKENYKKYKQVCIIPIRKDFLFEYLKMDRTPLEIIESVDMNRIIENGHKVRMVHTDIQTHAVDTIEDLKHVEKLMESDDLMKSYLK
jgi:3-deoxy-manno-octulosonate cytidylyltransferase (CMP-KDO synthetase)